MLKNWISHPKTASWLLLVAGLAGQARLYAGPEVIVGAEVPPKRRVSLQQIDHALWNQLLQRYVDSNGMVDYSAWQKSREGQAALDAYIAHLSAGKLGTGTRVDQLAFFINAYNAVTIKGILREYPTTSIRNHTAKLVGYNIWKDLKLRVDGQSISLDAMEHQHLRKMGEPRIHFAIVCASIGCPRLLNEAYLPNRLEEQLQLNTRAFFSEASKFRLDASRQSVSLSPILSWFGADFGKTQAAQLRSIAPYVPSSAKPALEAGRLRVSYLDYDWNLNDQRTARAAKR